MNEADQSRLTRWGVPGWTAILSFVAFVLCDVLLTPKGAANTLFTSATDLVKMTSTMSAAVAALLVAAAGVPLGFCIYQAYFYLRWNSPFSRDGLLPPFIVGRTEDLDRTLRDIPTGTITLERQWAADWVNHPLYDTDHGWRWRYIENFFTEVAQELDTRLTGLSTYLRHRSLLDLMHTLGASLAGVYLGFIAYLMYKVKLEAVPFTQFLLVMAASLAILILILDQEDRARKSLEKTPSSPESAPSDYHPAVAIFTLRLRSGRLLRARSAHPAVIYLIFLGFIVYLLSPSPYPSSQALPLLLPRLIVCTIPVIAWFLASRKAQTEIRRTERSLLVAALIVAFIVYLILRMKLPYVDWSYLWSTLFFLVINLVFLKNRQNVRDDLLALEYYTMRRYLEVTTRATPDT